MCGTDGQTLVQLAALGSKSERDTSHMNVSLSALDFQLYIFTCIHQCVNLGISSKFQPLFFFRRIILSLIYFSQGCTGEVCRSHTHNRHVDTDLLAAIVTHVNCH